MRNSTVCLEPLSNHAKRDGLSLFGRLLTSPPGAEHRRAFEAWINLNLELQLAELEQFLSSLPPAQRILLEGRLAGGSFSELVPEDTPVPERLLFQTDFEVILTLRQTS